MTYSSCQPHHAEWTPSRRDVRNKFPRQFLEAAGEGRERGSTSKRERPGTAGTIEDAHFGEIDLRTAAAHSVAFDVFGDRGGTATSVWKVRRATCSGSLPALGEAVDLLPRSGASSSVDCHRAEVGSHGLGI